MSYFGLHTHTHGNNTPTRAQQSHMGIHTSTLAYTVIQIVCAYTHSRTIYSFLPVC